MFQKLKFQKFRSGKSSQYSYQKDSQKNVEKKTLRINPINEAGIQSGQYMGCFHTANNLKSIKFEIKESHYFLFNKITFSYFL